jgi:hypothetical protein
VNLLRASLIRSGAAGGSAAASAGRLAPLLLASVLLTGALGGCYHFAGGGLPSHIKTVAILPFDNETASAELQQQLYDAMHHTVEGRLGLRDAAEAHADAVIKAL